MLKKPEHFPGSQIIGLEDDEKTRSLTSRSDESNGRLRKIGNLLLSGSFSFQNTSLYINTLFLASKEFGWISEGSEHGAVFGLIMAGGGLLFLANGKAYYGLLEDFVSKSAKPTLSYRDMAWSELARKGLGLYCSTAKVVATGVSTFILWNGITQRLGVHPAFAGVITAVTGVGNFACNMSIFLRPNQVSQTMQLDKIMLHNYLKRILGDDSERLKQIMQNADRLVEKQSLLSTTQLILSHLFAGMYALQNGLLYQDAYFTFAKQLGVVAASALLLGTISSGYFWLFMVLVGLPICVANYISYLPLIKDYFRTQGRPKEEQSSLLGANLSDAAWDGVAVGGASVKFFGTAFSTAKVGLQMTGSRSAEYLGAIIVLDLVLSSATYVANKAVFSRGASARLNQFGTFSAEIDELVKIADATYERGGADIRLDRRATLPL